MATVRGEEGIDYSLYIVGQILAVPLTLIMLIPFYVISKRENRDIILLAGEVGPVFSKITAGLYGMLCLVFTVSTICNFCDFVTSVFYPFSGNSMFIISLLLTACYGLYLGIEPLARTGGFIMAAVIISVAIILISLLGDINTAYYHGFASASTINLATVSYRGAVSNQELLLLLLMPTFVRGSKIKGAVIWTVLSALVYIIVIFYIITLLGNYTHLLKYPLYTLASMVDLAVPGRLDTLFMAIWVLVAFAKITLFLLLADYSFSYVIKKKSGMGKYFLAAVAAVVSIYLVSNEEISEILSEIMASGYIMLIFLVAIPLLFVVISKVKEGVLK